MKRYLLIFTSSLALLLFLSPIGMYSHPLKFTIANIAYCCLTYYLLRNTPDGGSKFKVAAMVLLPISSLCIIHALSYKLALYTLPSTVAHITGIFAGVLLTYISPYSKIAFLCLFLSGSIWVTGSGYIWWGNKVDYGTYSGQVNEIVPPFTLTTADGQTVSSASMKGKYVVFDFWVTSCGVCFKKFPQLQQYHNQYGKNANVQFFAVNIPLARDKPGVAVDAIDGEGYTFPLLFAQSESLASLFKVSLFPTAIIMDPSQHIIYRGQLDGIDPSLRKLTGYR